MTQNAEALQGSHQKEEAGEKIESREDVAIPFLKTYEGYQTLGGALNRKEYDDVLKRASGETGVPSDSLSPRHAKFMANTAEITLSPETVTIYGVLCYEEPNQVTKHYHGLSDQKLLAEALRISGDTQSLKIFKDKNQPTFNQKP